MKSWFEARATWRRGPAGLIARGNEARDARLWADAAEFFSNDPLKDLYQFPQFSTDAPISTARWT